RPTLLLIDFEDDHAMYFLCAAALAIVVILVLNLRRTRFGRVLIAIRENEANAESAAIAVLRTKVLGFGVAGGLAGFAGAILVFQQRGITPDTYGPQASVDIFIQTIV